MPEKPKLRDILQKKLAVVFKSVNIMKDTAEEQFQSAGD